jgi:hypothetical protein
MFKNICGVLKGKKGKMDREGGDGGGHHDRQSRSGLRRGLQGETICAIAPPKPKKSEVVEHRSSLAWRVEKI